MKKKKLFTGGREKLDYSFAGDRERVVLNGAGMEIAKPMQLTAEHTFKSERLQFGLFNSDNNQFHPGTKKADVAIKPEDFVSAPFRLITAAIVGGNSWKATDFSAPGVLKKSLKLLDGVTVFTNHNTDQNDWVGVVDNPNWQESATYDIHGKQTLVPAGINADLAIDIVTSPKVARGMLMGAIYSNSVGVDFSWKPSHDFESAEEFFDMVGKISPKDNKMVTRLVTEIHDYYETSLVWLGADPYAKSLDENGKLTTVHASMIYSLADEKQEVRDTYKTQKSFDIESGLHSSVIHLSRFNYSAAGQTAPKNSNTEIPNKMNEKILAAFALILGKNVADMTEDDVKRFQLAKPEEAVQAQAFSKLAKVTRIDAEGKEVSSNFTAGEVNAEAFDAAQHRLVPVATFTAMKTAQEEFAKAKPAIEAGTKAVEDKRKHLVQAYTAAQTTAGRETDKAVLDLIAAATPEQMDGLLKQYTTDTYETLGASCKSCGGKEIQFSATTKKGAAADDVKPEPVKTFDMEEVKDKYQKKIGG